MRSKKERNKERNKERKRRIQPNTNIIVQQRIRLPALPIRDLLFLTENSLVGVGEDANPILFTADDQGQWSYQSELDKGGSAAAGGSETLSARKVRCTDVLMTLVR